MKRFSEFISEGRLPPPHRRSGHHEFFTSIGLKHHHSATERGAFEGCRNHTYEPTEHCDHSAAMKKIHDHLTERGYQHEHIKEGPEHTAGAGIVHHPSDSHHYVNDYSHRVDVFAKKGHPHHIDSVVHEHEKGDEGQE